MRQRLRKMARQSENMDGKYIIYIPGIYCTVGWTDLIILETQINKIVFDPSKKKKNYIEILFLFRKKIIEDIPPCHMLKMTFFITCRF